MKKNKNEQTLVDHLEELRKRLFISVIVLFITTIIGFLFVDMLRYFLVSPAGNLELIYVTPPEALMANIRLAFMGGLVLSMPLITYQLLAFVFPGLSKNEKKAIIPVVFFMFIFFAAGISFAYLVVFPFAVTFFLSFATDNLTALFTITNYLSFATNFLFAFGMVFQLPLLFFALGKMNLVTPGFLRSNRKYALLIMVIVAALITPPDVVSQIMLVLPLVLLYELGVLLVVLSQRGKKKANS